MYLLYVQINQDSDFYIKDFDNLNYKYTLFKTFDEALSIVHKHLKVAIDTFKSSKDLDYVKETMIDAFENYLLYEISNPNLKDDLIYEMYENMGNYSILYSIRKVDFYKE